MNSFIGEPTRAHMEEVGRILPSVLGRHMPVGGWRWVGVLGALWPRVVGKGIAQYSRPGSFVSGTLTLATPCLSWTAQLGHMREEVRAGINAFVGRPLVRNLKVRHAPSLVLQKELQTENRKPQTGRSAPARPDATPAFDLANLDPEIARFVEEAFVRYIFKPAKRRLPGAEQ